MSRSRVVPTLVAAVLAAIVAAGWAGVGSGDPTVANRGWDLSHQHAPLDA